MKNKYLLLTPGPLSTSQSVKAVMMQDFCTWDDDYNVDVVQKIRTELGQLASKNSEYTVTLMQGSGTASVESAIGSLIPSTGKLLVVNNGAYGARIAEITEYLGIESVVLEFGETESPSLAVIERVLQEEEGITHVAVVHCETTTGMLNPVSDIALLAKRFGKVMILDAMSSFGGIPFDLADWNIDVMISSSNKCIQGVPGFGFVIAKKSIMAASKGIARSLSLDLVSQWETMEKSRGKWRFTSPTHVVRAFSTALDELAQEGGIEARFQRYQQNQRLLVQGMRELGFETLLADGLHSPIITSFYSPKASNYDFKRFYDALKQEGFVIYPGKVSNADCFRIGNIGEIYREDIERLLSAIATVKFW
ncbi:2-aminoethylphosphonate--pyruvate transaminase [Pseudoalteromonas xiamenensis]|uniref:2-aminoethylphosphonate--pyruvate transaminase n=1 Tax=Pseudoalteromonas xiamenensis TaxID=882626 RepID=UPI0027E544D8|nr:2-aminoethylphosphonate--pyruvate transaminase [Pseudoalteromonas xiamenensis]WMN59643.1 2-aminoethylphosphonate--pyruvate transaminase [Pseudoalteromonas xiamenensis]